ncbi:MAG: NADH-quinone oxidoreductase subunit J, partial [bacterium]
VLFLFVLMLLNLSSESKILSDKRTIKYFAIFIAAIVFSQVAYLIFAGKPSTYLSPEVQKSIDAGKIETIGQQLYTQYIIPFEVAGFLLLAATIGAMILAKKKFE